MGEFWRGQWGSGGNPPKPSEPKKKISLLVQDAGPISEEVWPDVPNGLVLLATQHQDTFFQRQKQELRPMLVLVERKATGLQQTIIVPDRGTDGFQEAFVGIIQKHAKLPGFEGAMTVTEGYFTELNPETGTVAGKARRESLIMALYDIRGMVQMRIIPFHRDPRTSLPVQDGPVKTQDREDGLHIAGRMVPDL